MKLELADDLVLPLEVVTEKLAWLGRTGSGKSYGAMKAAELMLAAGAQIGVIDPVGVWRALRVPAAPGGRSFEVVVFGGLYGDLPLEHTAGELIADLVCDRRLSFVLDVSQFIPAEQQRFVRAFAERFFHRKKSAPSAVHLFMEECQEFIPEQPSGLEALTLGAMQRLWKLGRNFGIGGSLISQRPQEIAKKALNMSGTLFAFQMTGPQERTAVEKWVVATGAANVTSLLQMLEVGQPHVESPTFLKLSKTIRILPRITADLSSTPKVGASKVATRPLTPIDIERVKESMAATIERQKSQDPQLLRARIVELERELVAKGKAAPPPAPLPPVEISVLKPEAARRLEELLGQFDRVTGKVTEEVQLLRGVVAQAAKVAPTPAPTSLVSPGPHEADIKRILDNAARSKVGRREPQSEIAGLGKLHRRILGALKTGGSLTRVQLGVRAVARSDAGHFGNILSELKAADLIAGQGPGPYALTPAGAGAAAAEPAPRELVEQWTQKLSSLAGEIFTRIVEVYPDGLTRQQLGDLTGKRSDAGHFGNMLSEIKNNGLIEGRGPGPYVAAADLFA